MMGSRPMRGGGRPNKVTKPGAAATARRNSRQSLIAAAAAASAIDPDLTAGDASALVGVGVPDDLDDAKHHHHHPMDDFATDSHHDHHHHLHGVGVGVGGGDDDVMGDAEADGEMVDDDDNDATAAAAVQAAAAAQNLDLSAAANILANGGGNIMGGEHDAGGESAYPEPTAQSHEIDFGAAAAAAAAQHHQQQQQQQQEQHHQNQLQQQAHMHHQQQQQQQQQQHDEGPAKPTEEVARDCGYGAIVVESALAKRLARERGLRPAQQRRPEQQLNLARRSNVEALFAHIAGEEVPSPCKNCHKGHGPWTTCVVVDGQMCGSCANCWYNASGARCSFHETRNPQAQAMIHPHHLAGLPQADANPYVAIPAAAAPSIASVQAAQAAAQAAAPQLGTAGAPINFASALATNDPVVRFTVERAMAEVRGADPKARQLMLIEIAAKQLALHMIEYEESGGSGVASLTADHHQQQQEQQQPVPDMGDGNGAGGIGGGGEDGQS